MRSHDGEKKLKSNYILETKRNERLGRPATNLLLNIVSCCSRQKCKTKNLSKDRTAKYWYRKEEEQFDVLLLSFCFVCLKLATIFRLLAKGTERHRQGLLTSYTDLSLTPLFTPALHHKLSRGALSPSLGHTPFLCWTEPKATPAFKTRGVTLISYSYSLNDTTC